VTSSPQPINTPSEFLEFLANATGKDLWKQFRKPNGDFEQWLHVWRMPNHESGYKRYFQYVTTPKPWLWAERPDGETLLAYYNLGMLKNAPQPWPKWHPMEMRGDTPVYCALLSGVSNACLQQYMGKLRSQVASEIDLMALLDKHYRLFK
jgi:hypothetical protein